MISKYGCRAILRRTDGDRDCIACMIDFIPRVNQGQLRNMPDRTVLVAAKICQCRRTPRRIISSGSILTLVLRSRICA